MIQNGMKNRTIVVALFSLIFISVPLTAAEIKTEIKKGPRYFVQLKETSFSQVSSRVFVGRENTGQVEKLISQKAIASLSNLESFILSELTESELKSLQNDPKIEFIEQELIFPAPRPVEGYQITPAWSPDSLINVNAEVSDLFPEDDILSPSRPWGILMVNAQKAWRVALSGAGARVAVLDTGIDKDHPSIKKQIEKMQDFIGDDNQPYPAADLVGHGTHVAGTILASPMRGGFIGVAPKAKLLVGRVCGDEGCSTIDVANGINWAIDEKVDVINMSLGGQMSTRAEKMAIDRAEAAGVVVVAASGNDGEKIKGTISFPASFPSVLSVGAIDEKQQLAPFSQYSDQLDVVAPGVDVISSVPMGTAKVNSVNIKIGEQSLRIRSLTMEGSRDVVEGFQGQVVDCGLGEVSDFEKVDVTGKVALIARGKILFVEKVKNAVSAGAAAIVVYNNTDGLIKAQATESGQPLSVPAIFVEQISGTKLVEALKTVEQSVSISIKTTPANFDSYSGTSMASPHVAGVVALMKAANKQLTPEQVRQIVKKTATPLGPNPENQFGAGLVNAQSAVAEAIKLNTTIKKVR